jgi:hypothetical protein
VRVGTELDRLAAVRPQILQRTEDVVDAAEEDRMLRRILATAVPVPDTARSVSRAGPAGRRRRAGLLAGAVGLAAAATAVAVMLSSGITAVPGGPVAGRLSARQILVAAASAAAARREGSGTYWHVLATYSAPGSRDFQETWTTRYGGTTWIRGTSITPAGRIGKMSGPPGGWSLLIGASGPVIPFPPLLPAMASFPLSRHQMLKQVRGEHDWSNGLDLISFAQLQRLPTNPAALKARLTALTRSHAVLVGPAAVFESLINLVTGLPAPPQVRAAAFRVLATLPIVTKAVTVNGRPGLQMSTGKFSFLRYVTLVVDPATSQIQAVVNAEGGSMSITAGWVNRVP